MNKLISTTLVLAVASYVNADTQKKATSPKKVVTQTDKDGTVHITVAPSKAGVRKIYVPVAAKTPAPAPAPAPEPVHVHVHEKKEAPVKIRFGLVGGLLLPLGDLKTKEILGTNRPLGIQLGVQASHDITQHHEVRASLLYGYLPGSNWSETYWHKGSVYTESDKNSYRFLQLGGDWVYNFENPHQGWYSSLGATLSNLEAKHHYEMVIDDELDNAKDKNCNQNVLGLKGGMGYMFSKNTSLEGCYNYLNTDEKEFIVGGASYVSVNFIYRF
jgi:hypothetical protein